MMGLPLYIVCLWGCSVLTQLIVLVLLFRERKFHKLPRFTIYTALNICQAVFLVVVYQLYGNHSATSEALAWASEYVTLLAQAIATTEILGITLKPYQGIWGLGWRALAVTSTSVVILVVWATRAQWSFAKWFEINRGYHLTFATTTLAFLLFVRYYAIPVATAYKMILGGFCFYSCTEIVINTLLQAFFSKTVLLHQSFWQFWTMFSFLVVLVIWVAALWKPLPAEVRQFPPPSDSEYQRLSPEINEQLRRLNEKLMRLWKMEEHPS